MTWDTIEKFIIAFMAIASPITLLTSLLLLFGITGDGSLGHQLVGVYGIATAVAWVGVLSKWRKDQ